MKESIDNRIGKVDEVKRLVEDIIVEMRHLMGLAEDVKVSFGSMRVGGGIEMTDPLKKIEQVLPEIQEQFTKLNGKLKECGIEDTYWIDISGSQKFGSWYMDGTGRVLKQVKNFKKDLRDIYLQLTKEHTLGRGKFQHWLCSRPRPTTSRASSCGLASAEIFSRQVHRSLQRGHYVPLQTVCALVN